MQVWPISKVLPDEGFATDLHTSDAFILVGSGIAARAWACIICASSLDRVAMPPPADICGYCCVVQLLFFCFSV
jgi:hypothetical protein